MLGSLGAMLMLAPRVYFAMARDGLFPAAAAAIHPRFGTPARAIATQAVLASVLVALGTFDSIVAYFVFVTVAFIALTVAAVFVLRRRDPALRVRRATPGRRSIFLCMVGGAARAARREQPAAGRCSASASSRSACRSIACCTRGVAALAAASTEIRS